VLCRSAISSPVAHLAESFDDWLSFKSSNFRSEMRRLRRRFVSAGGSSRLSTADTVLGDIDLFMRLHAARWRGRPSAIVGASERFRSVLHDAAVAAPEGGCPSTSMRSTERRFQRKSSSLLDAKSSATTAAGTRATLDSSRASSVSWTPSSTLAVRGTAGWTWDLGRTPTSPGWRAETTHSFRSTSLLRARGSPSWSRVTPRGGSPPEQLPESRGLRIVRAARQTAGPHVMGCCEPMRTDLLAMSDLSDRDIEAWRELGISAISPNPFFEPDFVIPSARAFNLPGIAVLTVRQGGEWLAALPVRCVSSWRGVPGRAIAAWRHDYSYLGNPLVSNGDPEAALSSLIAGVLADAGTFVIDWIEADGDLADGLAEVLRSQTRTLVVEEFERPALVRREDASYLERAVNASHRSQYRRARRRLEEKVGILTLRDDSQDPAARSRFLDLERSGWKGESGTRTAMACRPGHADFFVQMCERFARSGRLQLLSLANEEQVAAMQCDLLAGDMVYGFKTAYDEELNRFSPGVQLHIANLERFHDSGRSWIDSCAAPDNTSAGRLWPDRRRLRSIVIARPDVMGATVYAKWRAATVIRPLRSRIKRLAR
jgi:CelD/BcsL family acetyltransferase involved in cellulose biosynthesis